MSSARLYASSVMRSASGIVNGRSTSASIISNTAAFAPSPRASVTTTIALIAGRFRMLRQACRASSPSVRIRESPAGRDGSDGRSRLTRDGQLRRARAAMPVRSEAHRPAASTSKRREASNEPARAACSSCRSPRIDLAPRAVAERFSQQSFGKPGWRRLERGHDSSLPSSPCQSRNRLRREDRMAARPAGVTVK